MPAGNNAPRVLTCNIFFSPVSFGGATIVAENMASQLRDRHGWDVVVVASVDDPMLEDHGLRRYASNGFDIIGVRETEAGDGSERRWHNEAFNAVFADIVDRIRPDVVHVHCVQGMGGTFLSAVRERGIPLVVTVHDCYWICEQQFMITTSGRYCNQRRIDYSVCRYCVPDINATRRRMEMLKGELAEADLILFPSRFHRDLHVDNGFDPQKCIVNKNGVQPPAGNFRRRDNADPDIRLRFGFVGGPGPIKGATLISKAFNAMARTDYELVVVDAASHLGQSWRDHPVWEIPGKVTFVPGYTKETMDDFFGGIDVLLFPSQWKESFGLTVREAVARGVWVIATDAGGVAEDLVDGANATVIPFESGYQELRQAIEAAFDMPGRRPDASGITFIERQGDELDGLLRKLIGQRVNAGKGIGE